MKEIKTGNVFLEEMEETAIDRIRRFAQLAEKMGLEVRLGFSGGKDSQVVYDLMKRAGVEFSSYYNHCFESNVTRQFIREHYPDVKYRRVVKEGFVRNIAKNHNGFLPTVRHAYCCEDYKHNRHAVDPCSVVGVRRSESRARSQRTTLELKNKTTLKKNKALVDEYFTENCQSVGTASVIQLKPIIDWKDEDVWQYIHTHSLPVNPEYKAGAKRVGCIVCPKSDMNTNVRGLMKYPKLVDAFIRARESSPNCDWIISTEKKDYSDNKVEYICRWLNHSFVPFSKRQRENFERFLEKYKSMKNEEGKGISDWC